MEAQVMLCIMYTFKLLKFLYQSVQNIRSVTPMHEVLKELENFQQN